MTRRPAYPSPRWQTPLPPGVVGSWGPDVELYARDELGLELGPAQRRVLNRALAVVERSTPATSIVGRSTIRGRDVIELAHRVYLYSTGRQNGKTVTVRALIGWALTARSLPASWSTYFGLAFDKRQARIPYGAVLEDLQPIARRVGPAARGGLSLTRYLGIRSGMHGIDRRYDVASREAPQAIRGESIDVAAFDEVRTHRDDAAWAALLPTMAARPEPLAFLTSSAGDVRSILLRAMFDRGLRVIAGAEPPAGFGMTWYAAPEGAAPDDPLAWAQANPAIAEGRLTASTILGERYSLTPAAFRAERLNVWVDELGDDWLPAGVWARQDGPQPTATPGRVTLGVEAVPTWRRATITVAIALEAGDVWAGVAADLDASSTASSTIAPAQLVDELARLVELWRPATVAYSAASAAAPHVEGWLEGRDVAGHGLTGGDLRRASELFRSELLGGRLRHPADPLLAAQARVARPSSPVEAGPWYLSIRHSLGEIDALRALAWAAWAAIAPEAREAEPQLFV